AASPKLLMIIVQLLGRRKPVFRPAMQPLGRGGDSPVTGLFRFRDDQPAQAEEVDLSTEKAESASFRAGTRIGSDRCIRVPTRDRKHGSPANFGWRGLPILALEIIFDSRTGLRA